MSGRLRASDVDTSITGAREEQKEQQALASDVTLNAIETSFIRWGRLARGSAFLRRILA